MMYYYNLDEKPVRDDFFLIDVIEHCACVVFYLQALKVKQVEWRDDRIERHITVPIETPPHTAKQKLNKPRQLR